MKHKKSQIGATMTWIIAFVIIFFILAGFIFISTTIAVKKQVANTFFSKNELTGEDRLAEEAGLRASLFAVLGSEVSVNNTESRLLEAVLLYESSNAEIKNQIEKGLKDELNKICSGYGFQANSLRLIQDSSGKYTEEIIVPVYSRFDAIEIKYSQLRSC
jgi:hypothetical protein